LVGWVLCFTRHRRVNTHSTRNSSDLDNRLASDWKEALEINLNFLLLRLAVENMLQQAIFDGTNLHII
jgi:hypothetical protein